MNIQDNVIREYLKKCIFCHRNTLRRKDNGFKRVREKI